MIGLALVTFVGVLASGLESSTKDDLNPIFSGLQKLSDRSGGQPGWVHRPVYVRRSATIIVYRCRLLADAGTMQFTVGSSSLCHRHPKRYPPHEMRE